MSDQTVGRRYAGALLAEARRSNEVEAVDQDVALLVETATTAPDFERALRSPVIPVEKKRRIVEQLLKARLQAVTYRFVELLIDKDRIAILPEILRAYRALRDEEEGVVEATATLALPVTDSDRNQLRDSIQRMTGKRVRLNVKQDPALIGGIIVRVGDTVYDGSFSHQLATLREQMQAGRVTAGGDGQLR